MRRSLTEPKGLAKHSRRTEPDTFDMLGEDSGGPVTGNITGAFQPSYSADVEKRRREDNREHSKRQKELQEGTGIDENARRRLRGGMEIHINQWSQLPSTQFSLLLPGLSS